MEEPISLTDGEDSYRAVLERLQLAGWVTHFGLFHGKKFSAMWTPEGKEQMRRLLDAVTNAGIKPRQANTLVMIGLLTDFNHD